MEDSGFRRLWRYSPHLLITLMGLFKRDRARKELVDKIKKEDIDFSSVFSTINDRSEVNSLFKSLSRRCHPDRFVDDPQKMIIAEGLFKKVMSNSTNLDVLKELDNITKQELES